MYYLYKREIKDGGNSTAEQSIGTIFGTVAHTVVPTVTSNDHCLPSFFHLSQHAVGISSSTGGL